MIGIYKITNQINGKCYIGQSIRIEERFKQHKKECYEPDRQGDKPLYQAFHKYGIENFSFDLVEKCLPEELDDKEVYWIKYYNSYYEGYNATLGGQGKCFEYKIFFDAWDEGLSVSEIAKKYKVSPTTVRNYLLNYENYSVKESNSRGGKLAQAKNNLHSTIVYQYDLNNNFIKEWPSKKEVQRQLKISPSSIAKVCQGERKTAGGFIWKNNKD